MGVNVFLTFSPLLRTSTISSFPHLLPFTPFVIVTEIEFEDRNVEAIFITIIRSDIENGTREGNGGGDRIDHDQPTTGASACTGGEKKESLVVTRSAFLFIGDPIKAFPSHSLRL